MIKATICILIFATASFAADESQEPPLIYTLEVNDRQHQIYLNKPVQIPGSYNDPHVVLKASPVRYFAFGDVEFQYPSSFSWEAEIEGPDEKHWILSGNDFLIMYFILPDAVTLEEYAEALAQQFGEANIRVSDKERILGDHKLKGRFLFVKMAGTNLILEAYELPAKSGSRFLLFQDSPPDNRAISEEAGHVTNMVTKTFKYLGMPGDAVSGAGAGKAN